jgi:hypothetical protein
MSAAIHPLPQYVFMAWCLVKAQGQIYLCKDTFTFVNYIGYTVSTDDDDDEYWAERHSGDSVVV